MQYDKNQTDAIETTGTNILVSASAGAGKTGVLVARLTKRVVKDHIRVSRILALTFTQAAAAEMKKRLAGSLHEIYQTTEDPDTKQWLESQLIELEAAHITTIDSYCLTIIQKYFSLIGLDPATSKNILNEGQDKLYLNTAYKEALQSFIDNHHEEALSLSEYFSARSEDYDTLKDIIDDINKHAQAGMNPSRWYEEARHTYEPVKHLKDFPEEVLNAYFDSFKIRLEQIDSELSLMMKYGMDDEKIKSETLESKHNAIINCINALNDHNWSLYCNSVCSMLLIKTSANGKNEPYTEVRNAFNKDCKALASDLYDESLLVRDHNDLYQINKSLIDLAEDVWNRFEALKRKDACMDFSDMERYAYDILTVNNGTAASILRDSFDEIMIDEFQDTSELQNAIIDLIAKDNNVFRVGDVKQSIYRFRQARPQLMRNIMEDPHTHQITLTHNYRSMNSIVQFTNHLFHNIMNVEGCQDTYTERDEVTVGRKEQEEDIVPATFALIHIDSDNKDDYSPKEKKARWIASKILSMMKEDPSLTFHDFAILVRSHQDKPVIRSVFDACGIPYDIDAREGFYQSSLCQSVSALVRAMLNHEDVIALTSVLTSPLYQCTDEQLAQLKINYPSYLQGIQSEYPFVFDDLKQLKDTADTKGIAAMLSALADMHDFYIHLDDHQKANFDFLFEKEMNAGTDSLQSFLDIMNAGEDEKSSEAMSKGKDDDVVTVTTIHQSKGLQYKIVFLWSTSLNRFSDSSNPVIIDDTLKLGISHLTMPYRAKRPTVMRTAITHRSNIEDLEEFTRLLYVAVTRAEKRLFIVDTTKKDITYHDHIDLSLLSDRKGMTSLILNGMYNDPYMNIIHIQDTQVEKLTYKQPVYSDSLPSLTVKPSMIPSLHTPSSLEVHALPPLDQPTGTNYGTMMHETIESLPDRTWTMEDLNTYGLRENDKKKLLAFSSSSLYQSCLTREIHKEYPFYIQTDTERMTGSMDFVAIGDSDIILIDFKTDHADDNTIKERYTDQLLEYKKALHILYPDKSITAYAWSFHNNHEIRIDS